MRTHLLCMIAFTFATTSAFAMGDDELQAALERRFKDDRTGACVAAAVLDGDTTARAYFCADPKSQRPFDERTAFEIGSISKTMTAALLADFVARGEITLDDPIAKLLPPGTSVPSFNGRQMTIGDIVTHTSGLPRMSSYPRTVDINNPYTSVSERYLLDALAATQLTRAPGAQWEYSNFAMMVLSYALAKRSGKDFETLLRERLLTPLGMHDTYIAKPPPHVRLALGHLSIALPTGPWDFPIDVAGVGGVRATLPDMVRYLEGELGTRDSSITQALALSQQQVVSIGGHTMGMNWNLTTANGHTIVAHEGETGGYSSLVTFDRAAKRAVVLLGDTSLASVGGFGTLGRHLLGLPVPVGVPRIATTADAKLIDALVGRYRLQTGLGGELRHQGDALTIQADGQPEFAMGYDSAGDFYALQFDALLRPQRKADGTYSLTWIQLGSALKAERISPPTPTPNKWTPTEAQLADYEGSYPLGPGFALRVFATGDTLFIQGSNQRSLEVAAFEKDVFVAEAVAAEIDFARDVSGKVIALTLKQRGQVSRGERH